MSSGLKCLPPHVDVRSFDWGSKCLPPYVGAWLLDWGLKCLPPYAAGSQIEDAINNGTIKMRMHLSLKRILGLVLRLQRSNIYINDSY